MAVQSEVYFSRCRLPPSWIMKNCCLFFTIWLIVIKVSGNIETSIWNISMTWQMHYFKNSRWRSPSSCISKNCCHFITYRSIIIKFSILRRWFGTYRLSRKCLINIIILESWISKNGCNFFTIWPIITTFSRNITTLI